MKHCNTALRKQLLPRFLSPTGVEDMLQAVLIVGACLALTSYHEQEPRGKFSRHKHVPSRARAS